MINKSNKGNIMPIRISGAFAPGAFSGTSVTTLDEGPIFQRIENVLPEGASASVLSIEDTAILLDARTASNIRAYFTSTDMITWTARQLPSVGSSNFSTDDVALVPGTGTARIVGASSNSSNTRPMLLGSENINTASPTWAVLASSPAGGSTNRGTISSIAYNSQNNTWFGVGNKFDLTGAYSLTSTGNSITSCNGSRFGGLSSNVKAFGDSFISWTTNQYYIGTGTCGTTGTTASGLPATGGFTKKSFAFNQDQNRFVVTLDSSIWYSNTLGSFQESNISQIGGTLPSNLYRTVVYGNGVFLIAPSTSSGLAPIYSLDNGASWKYVPDWNRTPGKTLRPNAVAYHSASKQFVIFEDRDVCLVNTDRLKSL